MTPPIPVYGEEKKSRGGGRKITEKGSKGPESTLLMEREV